MDEATPDLVTWIGAEHDAVLGRFEQSVVGVVPLEHWRDPAGAGGSSLAWLAFHVACHEDLAVNAVLGGRPTVLAGARDGLGLAGFDTAEGLGETEQPALSGALDLDALLEYTRRVHQSGADLIGSLDPDALGAVPDSAAALAGAGVEEAAVPWLYRMWAGKPASFFVQWEAIGHRINHVGEMVSVRNRLGLSPF